MLKCLLKCCYFLKHFLEHEQNCFLLCFCVENEAQ